MNKEDDFMSDYNIFDSNILNFKESEVIRNEKILQVFTSKTLPQTHFLVFRPSFAYNTLPQSQRKIRYI